MGILDIFRGRPSPEKFARLVIDYLAKHGHAEPVRFLASEFQLQLGSGSFNLHNVYRDYCAAPRAGRTDVLARYAHVLAPSDMPETFAAARARLLPSIRSKSYIGAVSGPTRPDGLATTDALFRPLSSDAVIMLAYDGEQTIQIVMASTLEKWGVSFDDAYAAALDNLRDATVAKFIRFAPCLYVSDWNDSYDSSRILLPDMIHQLGLGATPVFMIPTRNRLLVAAGSDRSAMAKMIDLAHGVVADEGRCVSAKLYRLEGRNIVEAVPDDAELASNLKLLDLKFLADDYASQKAALEKFHQDEGLDIFVASFAAFQINGRLTSMSTLTKGVDTLLPRTDAITFVTLAEPGGDEVRTRIVAWDDAWAVLGGAMTLQEAYPPLYRITSFPSDDALRRMPALAAPRTPATSTASTA